MPSKTPFNRLNIQLWLSRNSDATVKNEQATLCLLSTSELKRYQSTRSNNNRRKFLLSRALMRHAFNHHFLRCENEWIFVERPGSSPIISNLPKNIYISLSHSNGLICLAISGSPIGIDIEAATKHRDFLTLAKTIMSDDEVNYYIQNASTHADLFYRMWCAKEAYYKALPSSEQSATSLDKIFSPALLENKESWFLLEGKIGHIVLAVVVKNYPNKIDCNYYLTTSNQLQVIWIQ